MKSYEIVALIAGLTGPVVYFLTSLTWPAVAALLIVTLAAMIVAFHRQLDPLLQNVVSQLRYYIFGEPKLAPAVGRPCPNNPAHLLDPNWERCPYCAAHQESNKKSPPLEALASPKKRDRTIVGGAPFMAERQETKAMPPGMAPVTGSRASVSDTRRIVGMMITYTWAAEGQLFPIREGRNFIGRGDIGSEALPRTCDVQLAQDAKMSAEHALILCRQGSYEIIDQETTNGTFVNGKLLRANESTELPNYAAIQTGATLWTFIKVDAPPQEQPTHQGKVTPDPGKDESTSVKSSREDTLVR